MKIFLAAAMLALLGAPRGAHGENWPQWRGPQFNGSSSETGLPVEWGASKNIVWSTPVPGPGSATPVIWGDRVFVTAADPAAKSLLALGFDATNGRELWRQTLGPQGHGKNIATSSPVTDGETVWFLTASGIAAAFTKDGKPVWQRDLAKDYGAFACNFGYSSSPLFSDGKLYILALQNDDPHKYGANAAMTGPLDSYLLALDPASGKTLWKQVRPTDATEQSRESYITPYPVVLHGRRQIILAGGECVTGHDPATGAELWRWWFTPPDRNILQHTVPTPVACEELLYIVRPEHRPLFALRPESPKEGQPANPKPLGNDCVAWTFETNQGWIASPLVYRDRLYVMQEEQRVLICLEPKSGRQIWAQKLPGKNSFQASPTGADGKIYCLSQAGDVVVLAAGDEPKQLAAFCMGEAPCRASIAVANGRLFIRTGAKLYCIAGK